MEEAHQLEQQKGIAAAGGLQGKIKEWVQKALALAKDVGAERVSITGTMPFGLSVTVNFSVEQQGGEHGRA